MEKCDLCDTVLDQKMDKLDCKNEMDSCQRTSRNRFWTIAVSCLAIIFCGYLWGARELGNCASEKEMKEVKELVTEASTAVKIQAKIFTEYIQRTEKRDKDQDARIRKLEDETLRDRGRRTN